MHCLLWRHLPVPSLLLRRQLPIVRSLLKLLRLVALLNLLNGNCSCSELSLLLQLQLLDLLTGNCSCSKPPLSCSKLPLLLPARHVIRLLLVQCRAGGPHTMVLLQLARQGRRDERRRRRLPFLQLAMRLLLLHVLRHLLRHLLAQKHLVGLGLGRLGKYGCQINGQRWASRCCRRKDLCQYGDDVLVLQGPMKRLISRSLSDPTALAFEPSTYLFVVQVAYPDFNEANLHR